MKDMDTDNAFVFVIMMCDSQIAQRSSMLLTEKQSHKTSREYRNAGEEDEDTLQWINTRHWMANSGIVEMDIHSCGLRKLRHRL